MAFSTSPEAQGANALVNDLQQRLVQRLQDAAAQAGHAAVFQPRTWMRDEGRHGGGTRWQSGDNAAFDRASVNVSAVHYDDLPEKKLGSATALSAIVHPRNPFAPSVHTHISYTALRSGKAYWRMMADLNPSIPDDQDQARFEAALRDAAGEVYEGARDQGDTYFFIPALERHRGITHFYVEGHDSGDWSADRDLAAAIGGAVIDAYGTILERAWAAHPSPSTQDEAQQLAYHTLYLFQVLTMDRGTTSGLLVHADNDVGILGSLPSHVNPALLASWADKVSAPQDQLVRQLVEVLPEGNPAPVTVEAKRALAATVRAHYQAHPEALAMQASGHVLPPTVANHR